MSKNQIVEIEIGKNGTFSFLRYVPEGHFHRGIQRKPSQASEIRLRKLLGQPKVLSYIRDVYGWILD